jgi:hypothetical protein
MYTRRWQPWLWGRLPNWLASRPEARCFDNEAERDTVIDEVAKRYAWGGLGILKAVGVFVVAATVGNLVGHLLERALAACRLLPPSIAGNVQGFVAGGVLVLLLLDGYDMLWRRPALRLLRRRLNELGRPVCVQCGYDLRGQTEARCPECGASFDPDLAGTQVSQRICEQPAGTVDDLPGG